MLLITPCILSPLHACRSLTDTSYPAFKFKKGRWLPCTLRVTNAAVERLDASNNVQWRLRFTDLRSPGIVTLDDEPPPRRGQALKLCGAGDRGQRVYALHERDGFVKLLVATAQQSLGLGLTVQVRIFCFIYAMWAVLRCASTPGLHKPAAAQWELSFGQWSTERTLQTCVPSELARTAHSTRSRRHSGGSRDVQHVRKVTSIWLTQVRCAQGSSGTAAEHEAAKRSGYVERSLQAGLAPLREFWLSRVKAPPSFFRGGRAPDAAEDGVGRFGRLVKAPRLLSLSEGALLEKGADGKYVSRMHDLRAVAALVVFEHACESRCAACAGPRCSGFRKLARAQHLHADFCHDKLRC